MELVLFFLFVIAVVNLGYAYDFQDVPYEKMREAAYALPATHGASVVVNDAKTLLNQP